MSRSACKIKGLKYPSADKITSRISTLRRSMACTLMHREACSPEQEETWAKFFGDKTCAYCGRSATHLDHLYPMIRDNEPTGYGTDPSNLVPCCEKCNRSKGNMAWEDFMQSENCDHTAKANMTPQASKAERIKTLNAFQIAMPAIRQKLDPTVKQQWTKQWNALEEELKKTETMLINMKGQVYGNYTSGNQTGTSTPKSSSSGTASSGFSDDQKFAAAAYYLLHKDASLGKVQTNALGIPPKQGNGNPARNVLQQLGIKDTSRNSSIKGLLLTVDIDDAIINAADATLKHTLEEIRARGLHLKL